jgi:cyclopropane fatty-acyl-phospholipid synthase-like methyltransferase
MFSFHHDRKRYFDIQTEVAASSILPIVWTLPLTSPSKPRILDVGCGEGGVLVAFKRWDCDCVGVDTDESRILNGRKWHNIPLIHKDIFECTEEELGGKFDLIILKDVIEHVGRKTTLLLYLSTLLNKKGKIFVAFPPWQMPFGGHQQMCSHWVCKLPYVHLLPRYIYETLLMNDPERDQLLDIRDCRLSIEEFETICKNHSFQLIIRSYTYSTLSINTSSVSKQESSLSLYLYFRI